MNGLSLAVLAQVVGTINAPNDLATISGKVDTTGRLDYKTGVGAGQANLMFSDRRTLAASANEDLDLVGSLQDPFGAILNFARIKAIIIIAAATNTNKVVVGGAAANAFVGPFGGATEKQSIDPGGVLVLATRTAAGWPVTPTTADLLRIANGAAGSAVTYDIIILGGDA